MKGRYSDISAGACLKIKGGRVGPNDYRFTINFSLLLRSAANIAAVLPPVGDGGGLVEERGWDGEYSWSPGGRERRAGRQMLLWAWGRGRAWAWAFRM
jgi:hypothetical protein